MHFAFRISLDLLSNPKTFHPRCVWVQWHFRVVNVLPENWLMSCTHFESSSWLLSLPSKKKNKKSIARYICPIYVYILGGHIQIHIHTSQYIEMSVSIRIRYLKCNKFSYAVAATYSCLLYAAMLHAPCPMPGFLVSLCWHPCAGFWRKGNWVVDGERVELRTPFAINMVHSWTFSIRNFKFPR